MKRHFVIFNPAAGRGRGAKRWKEYKRLLERYLDSPVFARSQHPGGERELAARAVEEGFDVIAAMGGDGTMGLVADTLVRSGADVSLGVLPNGTGNDFGRNLGLRPGAMEESVRILAGGQTRAVDVGRIESASMGADGVAVEGFVFLNVAGFGFDVAVIQAAEKKRLLKGAALYKTTALEQLFRFKGFEAALQAERPSDISGRVAPDLDGGAVERHLLVTVTNAEYFGGGFPIAPGGEVDDGALHLCGIRDAGPLRRLRLFTLAEKGRHTQKVEVFRAEAPAYRISRHKPFDFEADGEVRRSAGKEIAMRIQPRALRVVARSFPSRLSLPSASV